jgi:hypothetical protein
MFNEFIIVTTELEHCTFDQPWSSSGLLDMGGVVIVVIFLYNVRCWVSDVVSFVTEWPNGKIVRF